MTETRERLWVAEFRGPHIDGTAYLALPHKQKGYETSYVLASTTDALKAQRDEMLQVLRKIRATRTIHCPDSCYAPVNAAIALCNERWDDD